MFKKVAESIQWGRFDLMNFIGKNCPSGLAVGYKPVVGELLGVLMACRGISGRSPWHLQAFLQLSLLPGLTESETHPSILNWEILWTEEPGGLQSTGLQRVGYNWAHTHTHTDTHSSNGICPKLRKPTVEWEGWLEKTWMRRMIEWEGELEIVDPECWARRWEGRMPSGLVHSYSSRCLLALLGEEGDIRCYLGFRQQSSGQQVDL